MKRRPLGRSGIEVAPLAFGGNVFGWTVDQPTAFRILDAFVDGGFNLVDTANTYSTWVEGHKGGESETIIGRWFKLGGGRREKVVLATKVGMEMPGPKKGLAKDYILAAVEESLARLQTDRIDLYQSHTEDAATPIEETLEAYAALVKAGKVRAIGASNYSAESLASALGAAERRGFPRYETLQPNYNLYTRADFEAKLAPLCVREGVGVIPYFGLAAGFLTGKYRTEADLAQSPRGEGIKRRYERARHEGPREPDEVAKEGKVAVALAWLMARPAITGADRERTTIAQLREIMAAAELELDNAALEVLEQASA
jgi:aryl-alcohol dehydrogenase-like predicted oxidoreductase